MVFISTLSTRILNSITGVFVVIKLRKKHSWKNVQKPPEGLHFNCLVFEIKYGILSVKLDKMNASVLCCAVVVAGPQKEIEFLNLKTIFVN